MVSKPPIKQTEINDHLVACLYSMNQLYEVLAPHPLGADDLGAWGKLSPVEVHALDGVIITGTVGAFLPGGVVVDFCADAGDKTLMRAFIPYGQVKLIIGPADPVAT